MELLSLSKLSALSHPQRLALFRLMIRRYPDEIPAGEIAKALGYKPNTTSVYLSALLDAGLLSKRRTGTSLRYRADLSGAQDLVSYLLSECCRDRLDPSLMGHQNGGPRQPASVLFLCSGNSARSILAEALLRDRLPTRSIACSAGTSPAPAPNPLALEVLRQQGHETATLRSKGISEFSGIDAPKTDIVITLCDRAANEDCPAWLCHPVCAHWGLPNPSHGATSHQAAYRAMEQTYARLAYKIDRLSELDIAHLPRSDLQSALDQIGQSQNGPADQ